MTNNTQTFIEKAISIHGNKYDYSVTVYVRVDTNVQIICPEHGVFLQTPNNHIHAKRGCPKCSITRKLTTAEFIQRANLVHDRYYDYSLAEYTGIGNKIRIICPKHGEFLQVAGMHINGSICPKCMGISTEEFVSKAKQIHGNKYDYSEVDLDNKIDGKIAIICPEHNRSYQTMQDHLHGTGCAACGHKKAGISNSKTLQKFIEDSNKIHGNRYNYLRTVYKNDRSNIIVTCNRHGEFLITPNNHLQGQGCCKCGEEIARKKITRTFEEFLHVATEVHGHKYNYSKVEYSAGYDKIIIICDKHGEFLQVANTHLYGCGCSKCSSSISKPEIKWLESLGIPDTKETCQVKIQIGEKYIKVDGYIPETNTIYEFYGDFWHGNPSIYNPENINVRNKKTFGELYEETQRKRKLIIDAGYNLAEIWENEFNALLKKLEV